MPREENYLWIARRRWNDTRFIC